MEMVHGIRITYADRRKPEVIGCAVLVDMAHIEVFVEQVIGEREGVHSVGVYGFSGEPLAHWVVTPEGTARRMGTVKR